MAFPLVRLGPKPSRGQRVLDKEKADAEALADEIAVKKLVKARDIRCRWPEKHKCRGQLEAAHLVDASLGGAMATDNLILLCSWVHRRGPESIHGKQLRIESETPAGADGPLSFWKRDEDASGAGGYYQIKRETSLGILELD